MTAAAAGAVAVDPGARVAITGLGVLTPLGDSVPSLLASLRAGRSSLAPAPEPELPGVVESRIADFDAIRYANVRGMRIYNRTTRLGISAVRLALTDAGLEGAGAPATALPAATATAIPSEQLGIILVSTFGHLDTLMEYDRSLVTDGIQRTNPALMPLGLPSSPGAAIALSFVAKAFSVTLSDEGASALDAVGLATRLLGAGRARICVVVGAFAPFLELTLAARRAGVLATADAFRVFDRRRCGIAFGECAAALVLERRADAVTRGAPIRGLVAGQASAFASGTGALTGALRRASRQALGSARVEAPQVALVSAGANGSPDGDLAEAQALRDTLGASAARTPVMAVKANLGEGLDPSGLIQSVVALLALRDRQSVPVAGLTEPEVSGLGYDLVGSTPEAGKYALVTAASSTGACSALVLEGVDVDDE